MVLAQFAGLPLSPIKDHFMDQSITAGFAAVAFIDANIVLEGLSLDQLPWSEIHPKGPILVLILPKVMKEIDDKKNNARLNDFARRFNALVAPLAVGERPTVVVRPGPAPVVELALAHHERIEWEKFPDLDPNEPDERIVAEALSTGATPDAVFVSHDIRPLDLARRHGLKVQRATESWLRQKQLTEAEKKAAALERQLKQLRETEPVLELLWEMDSESVRTVQISDLVDSERRELVERILGMHPIPEQESGPMSSLTYDSSLSERYGNYSRQVVPDFASNFSRKLEINYGQFHTTLVLRNTGFVTATSLLVDITVAGGWLNDRWVLVAPNGPPAPEVRQLFRAPLLRDVGPRRIREKIEVQAIQPARRSSHVQLICDDFRHGREYRCSLICWVDPRASRFSLSARATAENLHGAVEETAAMSIERLALSPWEVVDREKLTPLIEPHQLTLIKGQKLSIEELREVIEFDDASWDR